MVFKKYRLAGADGFCGWDRGVFVAGSVGGINQSDSRVVNFNYFCFLNCCTVTYITIDTKTPQAKKLVELIETLPFAKILNEPNAETKKAITNARKGKTKKAKIKTVVTAVKVRVETAEISGDFMFLSFIGCHFSQYNLFQFARSRSTCRNKLFSRRP